jgi:DNA-binding response OmpR family regulator
LKKILLIEDEASVLAAIKSLIGAEFEIEVAADGQTGYYAISERKPAAVLLDVTVEQMNPVNLMGKIRAQKRFSALPFFVLVDSYPNDVADELLLAGAISVFCKCDPNYLDDLARELNEHFKPPVLRNNRPVSLPAAPALQPVRTAHAAEPATNTRPLEPKRHVQFSPVSTLVGGDIEPFSNDSEQLRALFAVSFGGQVHAARQSFVVFMTAKDAASRASAFDKFYKSIASIRAEAGQCELSGLMRLLEPLERRARELRETMETASAGSKQVLANAIDFMAAMNQQVSDLPGLNGLTPSALVMDDEAVSRRAITLGLEKANFRVTSVDSGDAAIRECEMTKFDLVLLDVEMPGLNGFAVCARVRGMSAHKETPILFISALDDLRSRASSKISGGNQFITKPVNFLELSITATSLVLKQKLKEIDVAVLKEADARKNAFVFPD